MDFGEALTKFGSVQNPFVEKNDTGTQGDPYSTGERVSFKSVDGRRARVLSPLPKEGHPHYVDSWV